MEIKCKKCEKILTQRNLTGFCHKCYHEVRNQETITTWKNTGKFKQKSFKIPKCIKDYMYEKQNNKCKICGMGRIWNNKSIVFVMDHIDGNALNNNESNLRLVCPNCDSQLDTYKSKNKNSKRKYRKFYLYNQKQNVKKKKKKEKEKKNGKKKEIKNKNNSKKIVKKKVRNKKDIICPICKQRKNYKSKICIKCYRKTQKNKLIIYDEKIELINKELYKENGNFEKVAKSVGISSTSLRKKLRKRGFPYHSDDYKNINNLKNCKIDNVIDLFIKSYYSLTVTANKLNTSVGRLKTYFNRNSYNYKIKQEKSKKVAKICLTNNEVVKIYNSVQEAEMDNGNTRHISSVCKGKRKTACGYYWKYI